MKRILKSGKPVFAICRGMQILSVACGGTIWQDMSLIPGKTLDHMQLSASRSEVSHRIRTERGSRLREYVGSSLFVNSFHFCHRRAMASRMYVPQFFRNAETFS